MAIGATCIWEVRTTGANTNGGGYTSGGVDKSQQDAAGWALTGCTSVGAGNTVLNANAHADMVGNVACCVSGTNFTISAFFEVLSVVAGVSITFGTSHAGASICTGVGANGVINIGGAFKIGGTLDDEWFDAKVAGNTIWIASGTYTLGESVSPPAAAYGTSAAPVVVTGYNATRGDNPTGVTRPLIDGGAYTFTVAYYWNLSNLRGTSIYIGSTGTFGLSPYCSMLNCKVENTATAGNPVAIGYVDGTGINIIECEAVSRVGTAITAGSGAVVCCYVHDSKTGISAQWADTIYGCIIDTCQTGIDLVGSIYNIFSNAVRNCVLGIEAGTYDSGCVINNIIADCVTGASSVAVENQFWDYQCWSNNGIDIINVTKGSHDVTKDALLVSGLVSGTDGATGGTGLVFTAASAPFSGVTTGDCLLIKDGGTGAVVGVYTISNVDSTSQITLATSAGANKTGITYGIVKGTNFTLGEGSPCFDAGMQLGAIVGL